ncbi:MAG: hypothetical protein V1652_03360 [bacterium]
MKIKFANKSIKRDTFLPIFKKYYFLFLIAGCIGFVGIVSVYKLFIAKPTYVYVKVKVGQGMWWASTQRPSLWFVKAIQQANEQKDLAGKPVAKILNVTYYPYWGSNQYDVYTTVQLQVSKVGNKGTYNFNRETIGVSSPIDLEFPTVQFSGTITALAEKPFKDAYEYKIVYLYKKYVNPWEYNQIQIGDSLSDGNEKVFEVLDKTRGETNEVLLSDLGKLINWDTEPYRYVTIKAKVRVKKVDGQYVFGEEYIVSPGRGIPVVVSNLTFNDYSVIQVDAK